MGTVPPPISSSSRVISWATRSSFDRFPDGGQTLTGRDYAKDPAARDPIRRSRPLAWAPRSRSSPRSAAIPTATRPWRCGPLEASTRATWCAVPTSRPVVGFIQINAAGENTIVIDLGATGLMTPAFIRANAAAATGARIVMAQSEFPRPQVPSRRWRSAGGAAPSPSSIRHRWTPTSATPTSRTSISSRPTRRGGGPRRRGLDRRERAGARRPGPSRGGDHGWRRRGLLVPAGRHQRPRAGARRRRGRYHRRGRRLQRHLRRRLGRRPLVCRMRSDWRAGGRASPAPSAR